MIQLYTYITHAHRQRGTKTTTAAPATTAAAIATTASPQGRNSGGAHYSPFAHDSADTSKACEKKQVSRWLQD